MPSRYMSKRIVSPPLYFIGRIRLFRAGRSSPKSVYLLPNSICTYSSRHLNCSSRIPQRPTESASTLTLVVAACLLAAGSVYLNVNGQDLRNRKVHIDKPTVARVTLDNIMVGPVLPGRPGNLTSDQEEKLQELWTATLKVFGVQAPDRPDDAEGLQSSSGTATPDARPKKKKHGMFRRQKDEDDDKASADQEGDKYGLSKAYQQVLATQNPENLRKAFWSMVRHDNPDGLLLRFLRARKWDVHNALVMLIATMNWRIQEVHVDDDIMKKGEAQAMKDTSSNDATVRKEAQDFLAQLKLGKSFLHGTDKDGRPMCFVRVRLHRQGEQSETSLERYTVYTIETARLLLATHVDTAVSHRRNHLNPSAHNR